MGEGCNGALVLGSLRVVYRMFSFTAADFNFSLLKQMYRYGATHYAALYRYI